MKQIHFSKRVYDAAVQLLQYGKLPDWMTASQKNRLKKRVLSGHYSLVPSSTGLKLTFDGLIVIPKEQIRKVLTKMYFHAESGRNGIHSFFDQIRQRFHGITRADVSTYLRGRAEHQRFEKERPKLYQPTIVHAPNQQWQIDYIIMNKNPWENLGFKYILTVVDVFSKYAFAFPTKTRESEEQEIALRHLFDAGYIPRLLKSDREFKTTLMKKLAKEYGFKLLWSSAYNPNSHAVIERFNQTLRNLIARWLEVHDTKIWLDVLQQLIYNYNHTKHSGTGERPADVYLDGDEKIIQRVDDNMEKIRKRAEKKLGLKNISPLKKGQYVRYALTAFPARRKEIMNRGNKRSYEPKWSSKIYEIVQVFKPRKTARVWEYRLEKVQKRFKHNELLPVENIDISYVRKPIYQRKFFNREKINK